ncbi:MAG: 16S rRNA (adenine(1518)-N(6)/adenine(1519)-N(6))-dimethyltransferase RsmA [Candidatus Micrarchaeaceae archaeon]
MKPIYEPKRRMGQIFLVNRAIAELEARYAKGKNVIEIGSGYGILTAELCRYANRVVSVEKDESLYALLKAELHERNLTLLNRDFFEVSESELGLGDAEMLVANIPYDLSSKTIEWLYRHRLEAVLCLQREFAERMLAKEGTKRYSKLSVVSSLIFSIEKIADVGRKNFRPVPRVDSCIVHMKPNGAALSDAEIKMIGLMMEHKRRTLRSAFASMHSQTGAPKSKLRLVAESISNGSARVFTLSPNRILEIARLALERI